MVQNFKENSKTIIFMEKVLIYGLIRDNTRGSGKTIKWMEKVFLLGVMEESNFHLSIKN